MKLSSPPNFPIDTPSFGLWRNNDPEQVDDYAQWLDLDCDALRVHVFDLD